MKPRGLVGTLCLCLLSFATNLSVGAESVYSGDAGQLAKLLKIQVTTSTQDDTNSTKLRRIERLLLGSFQVRAAIGRVDKEIAKVGEFQAKLEKKRDRSLKLALLANLASGVMGGLVGSSLGFREEQLHTSHSILDVSSGVVDTSLAAVGLWQQRDEHRSSEMLKGLVSDFLDLSAQSDVFPKLIWGYLDSPGGEGGSISRRQQLIERWSRLGFVKKACEGRWECKNKGKGYVLSVAVVQE